MWFIIIFGSIPVLRSFFMRFANNVATSSGYPFESTSRSNPPSPNHSSKNNWIPLDETSKAWTTCEPSTETAYNSRENESEENILPEMLRNGQITVTKTAHVQKDSR